MICSIGPRRMKDSSDANRSCTITQSACRIISFVANAPNSAREPGLSGMTMTREAIRAIRLLHERQVALHAVAEFGMSGLADQHVVRSWGGAGADTEQCIERRMPCSAPIEAEHELVEVVLEVGPPQSVVNAQTPALEI